MAGEGYYKHEGSSLMVLVREVVGVSSGDCKVDDCELMMSLSYWQ